MRVSKWQGKKPAAIGLRRKGYSIGAIERSLRIPRSTLSGWFKDIELSAAQKRALEKRGREGLEKARAQAALWHRAQKTARIRAVAEESGAMLASLPDDPRLVEIALAFLYLGEGSKKSSRTALGSSDPVILAFFVSCMRRLYQVPREKIRCSLHLRADQDEEKMIRYWSRALGLPRSNFTKSSFDRRTAGSATYPHYKGVCLVECGRVEIQRRLMYIAQGFCASNSGRDRVRAISSVG